MLDLRVGDANQILTELEASSVHLVATDPPYFLDGLDDKWGKGKSNTPRATGSVGGLPVGMKFDPAQGRRLQVFIKDVGKEFYRVMVPGSFAVVFSQPRLSHRMASGLEDAGFEIRDLLSWNFTKRSQFKAFSMNHFIERLDKPDSEKRAIKWSMDGRKTPQLRPQFEAIVLAQKPREGTFINNWIQHKAGLIDAGETLDGKSPATSMFIEKPAKPKWNGHLTVKPVLLMEHLIRLFTMPGQVVLDPFLGSGTTAVAAINTDRFPIGIDINPEYIQLAKRRVREECHV